MVATLRLPGASLRPLRGPSNDEPRRGHRPLPSAPPRPLATPRRRSRGRGSVSSEPPWRARVVPHRHVSRATLRRRRPARDSDAPLPADAAALLAASTSAAPGAEHEPAAAQLRIHAGAGGVRV